MCQQLTHTRRYMHGVQSTEYRTDRMFGAEHWQASTETEHRAQTQNTSVNIAFRLLACLLAYFCLSTLRDKHPPAADGWPSACRTSGEATWCLKLPVLPHVCDVLRTGRDLGQGRHC